MGRQTILYEETYKKGAVILDKKKLLYLIHRNNTALLNAELKRAGVFEKDGKKTEYQDIRVFFEHKES